MSAFAWFLISFGMLFSWLEVFNGLF